MSAECKIVKGLSWLIMLIGLAAVAMGTLRFKNAGDVAAQLEGGPNSAQTAGVIMCVAGVFEFETGVLGARGANHPARLGGFIVFASIIAIVNVVEIVLIVTGGQGTVWMNAIYVAAALTAVVNATRAKNAALDR